MNRIASFCVDHTKLEKGLYVSRIDGDVHQPHLFHAQAGGIL